MRNTDKAVGPGTVGGISATVFLAECIDLGVDVIERLLNRCDKDLLNDLSLDRTPGGEMFLGARGHGFEIQVLQVKCARDQDMWLAYADPDPIFLPEGVREVAEHTAHLMCSVKADTLRGRLEGALALSRFIVALMPMAVLWCPSCLLSTGERFATFVRARSHDTYPFHVWVHMKLEITGRNPATRTARITTRGLCGFAGYELRSPPRPAPDIAKIYFSGAAFLSWISGFPESFKPGDTVGDTDVAQFRIFAAGDINGTPFLSIDLIGMSERECPGTPEICPDRMAEVLMPAAEISGIAGSTQASFFEKTAAQGATAVELNENRQGTILSITDKIVLVVAILAVFYTLIP